MMKFDKIKEDLELDKVRTNLIENFIKESNKIEGIFREPSEAEFVEFYRFMMLDEITVQDLERFVLVYQPDARLRNVVGSNVRVGSHFPPAGGLNILVDLTALLEEVNSKNLNAFKAHIIYEFLHPFTDCNGRSGRMLWAWQMQDLSLGFLHRLYYQTLENVRKDDG